MKPTPTSQLFYADLWETRHVYQRYSALGTVLQDGFTPPRENSPVLLERRMQELLDDTRFAGQDARRFRMDFKYQAQLSPLRGELLIVVPQAEVCTHCWNTIEILKSNREKKEDLVATSRAERGIAPSYRDYRLEACPTILYYPPILSNTGTKLSRTAIMVTIVYLRVF